nr:hypothetical protein [Paenibacillus xylanexedens]
MLVLLIGFILLTALGIYVAKRHYEFTGIIITLIAGLGVLTVAMAWPTTYFENVVNIEVYETTKNSITYARESDLSEFERAALTSKIIEVNENLAKAKYWNNTMFGDLIPDKMAKLEYLK